MTKIILLVIIFFVLCFRLSAQSSSNCTPSMVTDEMAAVNGAPCTGASCTGAAMTLRNCSISCDNLVYNGYSDWRVPTIEELSKLVNITPNNTNTGSIWASAPNNQNANGNWMSFKESDHTWTSIDYTATANCRCVR